MSEAPEGWVATTGAGFRTMIGPFYRPADVSDATVLGFVADARHANKRGVVHGGMVATAFDTALGDCCWHVTDQRPSVTVQLSIQYISALELGDFAVVTAEIVRRTRTLIFARGTMRVGERAVATADGVWKILSARPAA